MNDKDKILESLGLMDMSHYEDYKNETVKGMIKFGDIFIIQLGHLLLSADFNNSVRIFRLWYNECQQYSLLYKIYVAKEKSELAEQ